MQKTHQLCPCGSNKLPNECCESIITGKHVASTAEVLMRSRYVAYTKANASYLILNQYSKTRPVRELKNIERWAKSVQ